MQRIDMDHIEDVREEQLPVYEETKSAAEK